MPLCLICIVSSFLVLCNVWHYLQVQMASWARAQTGQHSFSCCQMMPGTVFVQEDSPHCLPWTEAESSTGLPENSHKKFTCNFKYVYYFYHYYCAITGTEKNYLWLEVRSKLRGYLYSIITALRITVFHVCITFVAHAGASVVHIGTCYSQRYRQVSYFLCSAFHLSFYIILGAHFMLIIQKLSQYSDPEPVLYIH